MRVPINVLVVVLGAVFGPALADADDLVERILDLVRRCDGQANLGAFGQLQALLGLQNTVPVRGFDGLRHECSPRRGHVEGPLYLVKRVGRTGVQSTRSM